MHPVWDAVYQNLNRENNGSMDYFIDDDNEEKRKKMKKFREADQKEPKVHREKKALEVEIGTECKVF